MKRNLFWLVPFLVVAVAAFFLLSTKRHDEGARATTEAEALENSPTPPAKTLSTSEKAAQADADSAPDPLTQSAPDTGVRTSMTTTLGRAIEGRVRWKDGPLPQGLQVKAESVIPIEGKKEFPGALSEDGSFRIPVPDRFFSGEVLAQGEYHYSESAEVTADKEKRLPEVTLSLKTGGRIRGIVRQPRGEAAPGAKILLAQPLDSSMWMGSVGTKRHEPRATETDDEGRFSFRAVPPGKGQIARASREGFGPSVQRGIETRALQTEEIELTLAEECVLAGTVIDFEGKPVGDAKVQALPWQDMSSMIEMGLLQNATEEETTTTTPADGTFRIAGLANGKFRVHASKKGFESSTGEPITLAPGEKRASLSIQLGKGQAIAGFVTDTQGQPVPEAKISLKPDWMSGEFGMNAQWDRDGADQETKSDAEGKFRFEGLGKGAFLLEATRDPEGSAKRNRVKPGAKDIELRLQPQGAVRGRVTAAGIGASISKFQIRVTKQEGFVPSFIKSERFQDRSGSFEIKSLPPGTVTLSVTAEEFAPSSRNVEIRSGEIQENVDFSLVPSATVRGKIIALGSNDPVEGAEIGVSSGAPGMAWMQDLMNRDRARAASDEEGNFELKGLSSGKTTLRVTHADYANGSSDSFELGPGETIEGIVVVLSAGGGIDGFVYEEDGTPVSGASVFATGLQSGTIKTGKTDAHGFFSFEKGLAPGQYQVTSMTGAPEGGDAEEMNAQFLQGMRTAFAQVEEGKVARVILGEEKEGGCAVSGRVVAAGQGVQGAYVSLIPKPGAEGAAASTELQFAMSDKNGEFSIRNVASGKQSFSVQRGQFGGASSIFEVEIPSASSHRVEFSLPAGSIAGRVTDARTGKGIAGQWILVSPKTEGTSAQWTGAGFGQAQSDEEGRFQIANLKAGVYRVTAGQVAFLPSQESGGLGRATRTIHLAEGQTLENVDIALRPAAKIEGHVYAAGAGQKPVSGASIHFLDEQGENVNPISMLSTGEAGQFQDTSLSGGTYTVIAQAPGYAPASQKVTIPEGGHASVQLFLTAGTKVTIQLHGAAGAAIENATFQVFDGKGKPVTNFVGMQEMMTLWTGGQTAGSYALGTMTPGIYRVIVLKDGKTLLDTTVTVEATAEQTIELKASL